jgi:5,5'-dehydrodivanillate O-demethylase
MLSKEENERLTSVGPGTPAGELLRRYWQPICPAAELTDQKPRKRVQLLGEQLAVFRLPDGRYTLLAERCQHRGASLYYGFIEEDGVRCAYHGWKYGVNGKCLEQPFEPKESTFKERICQPAYPVQELAGLLFAYMGPLPAPLLPRWDVLVRRDGTRAIEIHPVLEANWLQPQENAMDTVHTYYLHGHMMKTKGINAGQYYLRPIEGYEFEPCEWGIVKRRQYGGELAEKEKGHPVLFPNALRVPTGPLESLHWRVPINDRQTQIIVMDFRPSADGSEVDQPEIPVHYLPSGIGPDGEYDMLSFPSQDKMAYETAGAIYDRTQEHLGASDKGVAMFRKLLREQIEVVARGEDPLGVIRDPAKNVCITFDVSQGSGDPRWQDARWQRDDDGVGWSEIVVPRDHVETLGPSA